MEAPVKGVEGGATVVGGAMVEGGATLGVSQLVEDLQERGQGPGLGLTAEGTILAVLIGQLWKTLPRRPGGVRGGSVT